MGISLILNDLQTFPGLVIRVGDHSEAIHISRHVRSTEPVYAPPPVGNVGSVDMAEQAAHFRRLHSSVRFDETDAMLKIEAAAKALELAASSIAGSNQASIVPKP